MNCVDVIFEKEYNVSIGYHNECRHIQKIIFEETKVNVNLYSISLLLAQPLSRDRVIICLLEKVQANQAKASRQRTGSKRRNDYQRDASHSPLRPTRTSRSPIGPKNSELSIQPPMPEALQQPPAAQLPDPMLMMQFLANMANMAQFSNPGQVPSDSATYAKATTPSHVPKNNTN